MELTEGVLLRYITDNSNQAARLEKAINAFPARIELSDLAESGDKPKLFATEVNERIVLRPHMCRIAGSQFGEGVAALSDSEDLKVVEYQGIKYNIMNIPLYE